MVTGASSRGVYSIGRAVASPLRERSSEETALPKIDVAIVDDDCSVREATKRLLQLLGYTTASFATAEEFLESGRVGDTVCLIVDMHLPGMSGAELQSRLSLDGYRLPIIFITAFAEEEVRARVLGDGALGYLFKPVREQSLIDCLDEAFRRSRNSLA
jgi:FixJ family two-component response regulator